MTATQRSHAQDVWQQADKNRAGVWIDHRRAVVVQMSTDELRTTLFEAGTDRDARHHGGDAATVARAKHPGVAEDTQQRHFEGELEEFYQRVIVGFGDTPCIWIFGPGEARRELCARLERQGHANRVVAVESADKMTDAQVAAKVRAGILPTP